MAQPYVHAGAAFARVPVTLSGPNMLPVTANVAVSQRTVSKGESGISFCLKLLPKLVTCKGVLSPPLPEFGAQREPCVADGALQIGLPPAELTAAAQNSSLQWLPGQNGTIEFSLPLAAMGSMLQQGVLVLQLGNVTNADLSAERGTCLVSELPQENLTVGLTMQPYQVCILPALIYTQLHPAA